MPNPYGYSPPFVAGFGLKRRPCRHPCVYPPPKSPSLEGDLLLGFAEANLRVRPNVGLGSYGHDRLF